MLRSAIEILKFLFLGLKIKIIQKLTRIKMQPKIANGIIFMREDDPRLPVENYDMWNNEAYTAAQLQQGVDPNDLFPGVGRLFASNKRGWYAVANGKRVAEREWEDLSTYLNKITNNAVDVAVKYPACKELAEKHLKTIQIYAAAGMFCSQHRVAHFAGLAVDPEYRGMGLARKLVLMSLQTLRESNYTEILVETTGNGSKGVIKSLEKDHVISELAAIPYSVPMPDDEEILFRVFHINLS